MLDNGDVFLCKIQVPALIDDELSHTLESRQM